MPCLEVSGKHCLVTGGSTGLGLSLCRMLAVRGAHVTVFARRTAQLEEAIADIQSHVVSKEQRVLGFSVDCTNRKDLQKSMEWAIEQHEGRAPFILFCCVGSARPLAKFLDHASDDFAQMMTTNYLSAVYAVRAGLPFMITANVASHVVLVSSVAGLLGFGGYSAYAPSKAALKALADSLRHELVPTPVKIHLFLPASFESPGYQEEMKMKPTITRRVEESDPVISSDKCAKMLLNGLRRGDFMITTSFTGDLIRCAGLVHSPVNSFFTDFFKLVAAYFALIIWRRQTLDPIAKQEHKSDKKDS